MRKSALLLAVLTLILVAGCGGEAASPTPSPTAIPPAATATPAAAVTATPSGPATCEPFPLDFPVSPDVPPVTDEDHVQGPADARVTLIEYSDFQCPGCSGIEDLLKLLLEVHAGDLRIVYRHFPLTSIHDKATITSEASEAAAAQGKFWEMHDLLFQHYDEWTGLPADQMPEVLAGYAQELGLDVERFREELENRTYQAVVQNGYDEATSLGLPGTPSFIIDDRIYPWNLSYQGLETFIQLMLVDFRQYDGPPPQTIDPSKKYTATIRTSQGDIVVELFAGQAPVNVNSFVFLAREAWYDGQAFFFVRPDLAARSGDPTNMGVGLPYPGYYCGDEHSSDLTFDQAGMLALYAPSPGLNGSEFFITFVPKPDFNGQYTIIGRIVEGLDVAKALTPTQPGPGQPAPDIIETILIAEG